MPNFCLTRPEIFSASFSWSQEKNIASPSFKFPVFLSSPASRITSTDSSLADSKNPQVFTIIVSALIGSLTIETLALFIPPIKISESTILFTSIV